MSQTLLGACCLLYLAQNSWLFDGRPLHLFLSFQPEGNFISLQFFLFKDICHWTLYKSFKARDSCKTRKAEVATCFRLENNDHFNKTLRTSSQISPLWLCDTIVHYKCLLIRLKVSISMLMQSHKSLIISSYAKWQRTYSTLCWNSTTGVVWPICLFI